MPAPVTSSGVRAGFVGIAHRFAIIFPMLLTFCAFLQIELFCLMNIDPKDIVGFLAACHFAWVIVPEAIVWFNRDNGWVVFPIALFALAIAVWLTVRHRRTGKSWP